VRVLDIKQLGVGLAVAVLIDAHFAVFGASGALVFALLTWLVLTFLFRPNERQARG
jgi:uncharacterized membrane protein